MVYPIVTTRSDGSKVWDVDGNEYVDFVMGFGASLFGHRPPFVVEAVREQLEHGFEIGPIQPLAGEVAALMQGIHRDGARRLHQHRLGGGVWPPRGSRERSRDATRSPSSPARITGSSTRCCSVP